MKLKTLFIVFLLLTGCQNANQPYKSGSGYVIFQTKENQFQVEVHGLEITEATKIWEARAAEICPAGKETIYTNIAEKNKEIKYVVNGMQQSTWKKYLVFYGEFKCNGVANKNIAIDTSVWQKSEPKTKSLQPASAYLISTDLDIALYQVLALELVNKDSPVEAFARVFGKPRKTTKENETTYHEWIIGENSWLQSHVYADYKGTCLKKIVILPPSLLLNIQPILNYETISFNFYVRKIDNCINVK